METHQKVLKFINHFTNYGNYKDVITSFTAGNCYYFAVCLFDRFDGYDPVIVYDPIANHWACEIEGRIYDITGELTDINNFEDWYDFVKSVNDYLYLSRLYEQCIKF